MNVFRLNTDFFIVLISFRFLFSCLLRTYAGGIRVFAQDAERIYYDEASISSVMTSVAPPLPLIS